MPGLKHYIKRILFETTAQLLLPTYHISKDPSGSSDCGISMLLCHRYVFACLYTLSSLFYQMKSSLPVFIVDDGSLTGADKEILQKHFTVTFTDKVVTESKLKKILRPYPELLKFRFSTKTGILKKKLLDAALLHPFRRFILLDADILFYRCPKEIISWVTTERDYLLYGAHEWKQTDKEEDPEIIIRKILYTHFPSKMHLYNSTGLLCIPSKNTMNLSYLQEIVGFFEKVDLANRWLAEQHALSLLLGKQKLKLLPTDSYINVWKTNQYDVIERNTAIAIHYAGDTKVIFPRDALTLAYQKKLFS